MPETGVNPYPWIERLVAVAVLLQTIEYFQIRRVASRSGIWSWPVLREAFKEFPQAVRRVLDVLLDYPGFMALLGVRFACAVLTFAYPQPVFSLGLFLTTVLICLRWRGTFNGGSDYMTLIVLGGLCVGTFFGQYPAVAAGALWYVGLQVCLSYFVAGLVKLRAGNWRSGRALSGFLSSSNYAVPGLVRYALSQPLLAAGVSWGVILFECSFPLVLLSPHLCAAYIGLALAFHLAIAYLFGLNRFLFAWGAAYPALYYCSQYRF
jgi:hypothetical protein